MANHNTTRVYNRNYEAKLSAFGSIFVVPLYGFSNFLCVELKSVYNAIRFDRFIISFSLIYYFIEDISIDIEVNNKFCEVCNELNIFIEMIIEGNEKFSCV